MPEDYYINLHVEQYREHMHMPSYLFVDKVMPLHVYPERIPGFMIFTKPLKVEWSAMQDHLYPHGYRWNSDVYYIMPGSKPPQGMVLISCEEHVHAMMEVLQGLKKCDLYLVRNYPSSDDSDDDMCRQDRYKPVSLECDYRPRDTDSDDDRDLDQYGSSPSTKQPTLNNPKKTLNFGSDDGNMSA